MPCSYICWLCPSFCFWALLANQRLGPRPIEAPACVCVCSFGGAMLTCAPSAITVVHAPGHAPALGGQDPRTWWGCVLLAWIGWGPVVGAGRLLFLSGGVCCRCGGSGAGGINQQAKSQGSKAPLLLSALLRCAAGSVPIHQLNRLDHKQSTHSHQTARPAGLARWGLAVVVLVVVACRRRRCSVCVRWHRASAAHTSRACHAPHHLLRLSTLAVVVVYIINT